MKNLIAALLLCFITQFVFAQFPINTASGNTQTLSTVRGASRSMKGMVNGVYPDTTTANNDTSYISHYPGAQIYTSSDDIFWIRNAATTAWVQLGGFIYFRNNFFLVTGDTVDLINVLDTLRRVGLDVQGRKNGIWTYQFTLPDSTPTVTGVWLINGNTGIDDANNFLGTLNDADVVFRRNNIEASRYGVDQRISIGEGSSAANDRTAAFGFNSFAGGIYSAAVGPGAIANSDSSLVLGDSVHAKVGIGKSIPQYSFDLTGNLRLDITNSSQPGYFLTNIGSGVAEWQPGSSLDFQTGLIFADPNLVDTTVTLLGTTIWKRNGIQFTDNTEPSFPIVRTSPDYKRIDAIAILNDNTFDTIQGIEDQLIAVPPSIPAGDIVVSMLFVHGDTVQRGQTGFNDSLYWRIGGNSNTTGSTFIGTTSNRSLYEGAVGFIYAILDS